MCQTVEGVLYMGQLVVADELGEVGIKAILFIFPHPQFSNIQASLESRSARQQNAI